MPNTSVTLNALSLPTNFNCSYESAYFSKLNLWDEKIELYTETEIIELREQEKQQMIEAAKNAISYIEKYNKFTLIHIFRYMNYVSEETPIKTTEKQKEVISSIVKYTIRKGVESNNLEALLAAITFFDFELTAEEVELIDNLPEMGFSGELPDIWPDRIKQEG